MRQAHLAMSDARLERENAELRKELAELRATAEALEADIAAVREASHTDKMRAVGRVAAGVAHDFNNFLSITSGNAELLARELEDGDPRQHYVDEISRASERCRTLVRQLLLFSRQQTPNPQRVAINDRLESLHRMIELVVGDGIRVETALDASAGSVMIDPSHFEQMVMNLVINAREAMPEGGDLYITSEPVDIDARSDASLRDLTPGRYVRIRVRDTGSGIAESERARVFEPFFSTKADTKVSGLGLSAVYAIASQAGGKATLDRSSDRGGSTFDIVLPAVDKAGRAAPSSKRRGSLPRGEGTILFAEDEPQVRSLTQAQLERGGYRVLAAESGESALALAAEHGGQIDVLVSDIMMPGINGIELARRVVEMYPDVPVLFVSGYSEVSLPEHGPLAKAHFLPKPYTMRELLSTLSEILEDRAREHVAVG